jgi:hypothetical protein
VDDLAVPVQHIYAVWPTGIRTLDLIVDRIDQDRHREPDFLGEILSDFLPLGERLGISNLKLRWSAPLAPQWVRLADIDDEDVGLVLVRLKKLLDRTDRAEKRRSRTAPEDQHYRLALQARQPHAFLSFYVLYLEVGSGLSYL